MKRMFEPYRDLQKSAPAIVIKTGRTTWPAFRAVCSPTPPFLPPSLIPRSARSVTGDESEANGADIDGTRPATSIRGGRAPGRGLLFPVGVLIGPGDHCDGARSPARSRTKMS